MGRRVGGVVAAMVLATLTLVVPIASPTPEPTLAVVVDVADPARRTDFVAVLEQVRTDPRGWAAAGVTISVVDQGLHRIGLATSAQMAQACAPYGAASKYACRPGIVGMVNAGWWDRPPEWWTGSREDFRRRAVNHELGHLLGLRAHPPCPGPGRALPVMALPPRERTLCAPSGWPGPAELAQLRLASR